MTGTYAAIFWLIIAIILFIIEGAVLQLVCIWFAFGALVAMLSSFFGAPFIVQLILFFISSISVLLIWRPMLKAKLTPKKTATNADAVIGQIGHVVSDIDNVMQTGRVIADGLDWTARSKDDGVILSGQKVRILQIDGVKLIVEPIAEYETDTANVGGNL